MSTPSAPQAASCQTALSRLRVRRIKLWRAGFRARRMVRRLASLPPCFRKRARRWGRVVQDA